MKLIPLFLISFLTINALGQQSKNFELIDKFKLDGIQTKVFFNDPLKDLLNSYPDFDKKEDKEKYDLLDEYLHQNSLYVFQTIKKNGEAKSYVLKGNIKKVRTARFFNLEIFSKNVLERDTISGADMEKSIDKINVGGTFFENMFIFKDKDVKELVGRLTKIWGYFTMVQSYSNVKSVISDLILQNMKHEIPDNILVHPEVSITPLFDYETCGIKSVIEREMVVTVYQYDTLGVLKDKSSRIEKDADLYHASTSADDVGSGTAFPFFSSADTVVTDIKNKSILHVKSTQAFINHYLEDVKVFKNLTTGDVERIESKLKIHGYSASGESISYELYVAEFAKFGDCYLPKTVKFYPDDDFEYKIPVISMEITYKFR